MVAPNFAEAFDIISWHNPEYQNLIHEFQDFISDHSELNGRKILVLGTGTGHFSIRAALNFPESEIWHVEYNKEMLEESRIKCGSLKINNIVFIENHPHSFETLDKFDLIISINTLFTQSDPKNLLDKICNNWTKENSLLFLNDIGKTLNFRKIKNTIICDLIRNKGVEKTINILNQGNLYLEYENQIEKNQKSGIFWKHSLQKLKKMIINSNFSILKTKSTYFDFSNLVIARKFHI